MTPTDDTSTDQTPDRAADDRRLWFNVVIRPNRSLGKRGFAILMGLIVLISAGLGIRFMLIGAWPVLAFFGLDVLLIYFAFKINYAQARAFETIQLSDDELLVTQVTASGRSQETRFQPYWLKLSLKNPQSHVCRVEIASHGRRVEVGNCLSPDERRDLALALDDALARHRGGVGA